MMLRTVNSKACQELWCLSKANSQGFQQ